MKYSLRAVSSISGFSLVVIVASLLATFYTTEQPAHASSTSWFSGGATVEPIDDPLVGTPKMINHAQQCSVQKILINRDINPVDSCIYQAKSFRFGWVDRYVHGQNKSSLAISLGADQRFYMISNMKTSWYDDAYWHASPGSDDIVFSEGKMVMIFKDVPKTLNHDFSLEGLSYRINYPEGKYSFGNQGRAVSVAMSNDGRWLVGGMADYGLFRMRLADGSVRLIAGKATSGSTYHLSISNSGTSVISGGTITSAGADITRHAKLFTIDTDCGKGAAAFWSKPSELAIGGGFTECPYLSLNDMLTAAEGDAHNKSFVTGIQFPRFNDSGDVIDLIHSHSLWSAGWLRVYKPGYIAPSQMEYIALGDSYSSGEGDVDRKPDGSSFYLPGTDGYDKCHISSRSYPFLLRDHYGISTDRMKSVACSGAQVVFDYLPNMKNYAGQHGELSNESESGREEKRQDALNNFTPGIVPQVEFVKKHKPRTVTLTGGGNDVGFGEILAYCATPHWEELVLPSSITDCGYAIPGSDLQKLLYGAIDTQYTYNKMLVGKLKEVSPTTRIIIVGYPSFISSDTMTCSLAFNSGALSQKERTAINAALSRMSTMLRRLAYDTGVSYVDVEDTLNGGRMCEGSKYITGVTAVGYNDVIFEGNTQETFHPNALGHEKIADTIKQSGVFESNKTPSIVGYLPNKSLATTLPAAIVGGGEFTVGSSVRIATSPFMFMPNSSVNLVGFSDRVELRTFTTDAEGKLEGTVDMSLLPTGRHVLLLEGATFSGEPVKYYQFISVIDPPPQDAPAVNDASVSERSDKKPLVKNYESDRFALDGTGSLSYRKINIDTIDNTDYLSSGNRNTANTEGDAVNGAMDTKDVHDDNSWILVVVSISGVLLVGGVLYAFKQ